MTLPARLLGFSNRFCCIISSNPVNRYNEQRDFTERSIALKGTYEKPVLVRHEPLRDVTAIDTSEM